TEVRTVRVLADGESVSADYGALSLTAEQGRLHLTWNGYTAEILPAAEETAVSAEIVVRYGGTPQTADSFAKRLLPALPPEDCTEPEYGGQNMLIRVTASGKCDIRPL
ncbi:MAG: hypothetical protein IK107_03965, partial [Oscillospiraceae bacterium]|nr:hypothetical protein [Oscillospiraceae bacterium]